jgi:hypothetical protein
LNRLATWLQRAAHRLDATEQSGRLSVNLLAGDMAFTGWLAFAQRAFSSPAPRSPGQIVLSAALVALLAWLWRWHDFRGGQLGPLLAKGAGAGLTAGLVFLVLHQTGVLTISSPECWWLATGATGLLLLMRVVYRAARVVWPDQSLEVFRWIAVVSAVFALIWPFCTADALGAGDADWYTTMLADFTAQWRAGVFPVWIGQSEYAFNGAISPLRFAPWFQHWGGVLDLLTGHALGLTALKNAVLVTAALAGGLAAYAALRAILHRRPWLAALLAALWMASPGVLAPLMAGDQYMTFMTLPFVVVVLYGTWRIWVYDDRSARRALAAGLAGLWLSHTPVALWMGLLAGANYAAKIAIRRTWRFEARRLVGMGTIFLMLGSFPLVSILALDNLNPGRASGGEAVLQIARIFPANFLPIHLHGDALATYQLGYTAIGVFVLTVLLLIVVRPLGARAFVCSACLITPFTVPVPWITLRIWTGLPDWFVTINYIWPMQRLFLIWTAVIFFGLATVAAHERIAGRRWWCACLAVLLLGGAAWSWPEARKLAEMAGRTRLPADQAALQMDKNNIRLTRYAYASFVRVPAYASHSYMDPYLENRLLDRNGLKVVMTNGEAAAPRLVSDGELSAPAFPRLVQSGVFTAVNDNGTDFNNLTPLIVLRSDTSYALRLEFLQLGDHGVLQILHERLFREYYLPDSGAGMSGEEPSLAFGSEAQSSKVIPLRVAGPGSVTPRLFFITPRRQTDTFPFARFWLFTYENSQLPVAVESWIPYRARVQSAIPVWLETPRIWQSSWRAQVNGRDVKVGCSPQNLAMVPVEPGYSRVVLYYRAPWWLQTSYWACLGGWSALALAVAVRLWRAARKSALPR